MFLEDGWYEIIYKFGNSTHTFTDRFAVFHGRLISAKDAWLPIPRGTHVTKESIVAAFGPGAEVNLRKLTDEDP